MRLRLLLLTAFTLLPLLRAAVPEGYYDRARGLSGGPLKASLHAIIRDHTVIPYAALHAPLCRLHEDPANPANVILLYSGASVPKGTDFTSAAWNREHSWPRSRGNSDQAGPDDSDLHYLWPAADAVNSARGNLPYDLSDRTAPSFRSPGHALAPQTSLDSDSWEPPAGQRGPLARTLFYVATRYDGDEPLTSDMELVAYAPTGSQMGNLNTLLRWHAEEPVTAAELRRNDLIHAEYQRNRNPFIDHPEWVALIWGEPGANSTGSAPLARLDPVNAAASEQPRYEGSVRVSLTQAAPAGGLRIDLRLTGTATPSADYTLAGSGLTWDATRGTASLRLPAGATAATITLTPAADPLVEPAETATFLLEPGPGYTVVPNASQTAAVLITDSPQLPAVWRFDAGAPFASPLPADTGGALLRLDEWKGAVTSFSGVTGDALALVGSEGNGSSLLLSLSLTGRRDLTVTFQTRGTSTGFNTGTWAWSTDGTAFTPVPNVNTATTGTSFVSRTVDFSSFTALTNAPLVTLRYTLSGATSTSGNNRLDNLTVSATPLGAPAPRAPAIQGQSTAVDAPAGTHVLLVVDATAEPAPAYQWTKDGSPLPGATAATLALPLVTARDAGTYAVEVANASGRASSRPIPVRVTAAAGRLLNVATRARAGSGERALLAGFTLRGTSTKAVLVRAAGPALAAFGLTDALPNPRLVVRRDGAVVAENDDWSEADAAVHAAAGAFPFAARSRDAALVATLAPGGYTAEVTGPAGEDATGTALVEVYELGPTAPRLVNLSTRAFVGTAEGILIPGVVVGAAAGMPGSVPVLLVRAVGPGLAAFGLRDTVALPELTVRSADGTIIARNLGWQGAPNRDALVAATSAVGAFPLDPASADSALLLALPPGAYTLQVRGADQGTGIALVEVYELP